MRRMLRVLVVMLFCVSGFAVSAQDVIPLEIGVAYEGELSAESSTLSFSIEVQAGDYIGISMLSNEFESILRVFSPSGALIDETGPDTTAFVGPLEIETTGRYLVVGSTEDISGTHGFYLLAHTVEQIALDADTAGTGALAQRGMVAEFTFEGQEGNLFGLFVEAENSGWWILNPDYSFLMFDGFYTNPSQLIQVYPQNGVYRMYLMTINDGGTDYALGVRNYEPIPLAVGQVVAGTALETFDPLFSFESAAGKTWELNSTLPLEGDRSMFIAFTEDLEPWEFIQEYDSGSGPEGNPRISPFTAPADGTYYVLLHFNDYDSLDNEFAYELMLTPGSILSLAPGTPVVGTTGADTGSIAYQYRGTANELIRVTVARTGDSGGIGLGIYSPEDDLLLFSSRNAPTASFEVVLPLDGVYEFEVWDASWADESILEFSLLIEPAKN